MINILQFISKLLLGNSAAGNLTVSSAISQVEIKTGWTPKIVFIGFEGHSHSAVCGSHQDWFDVKIVNQGFVLQCNIKSSFRKITWMATK